MRQLVEFALEGGGSVLVEIDVPETPGMVPSVRPGRLAVEAQRTFEQAMSSVSPIATVLLSKVRELTATPDEVEVEFGLKLTAEAGAVLASAGAEAHCVVSLTWKKEDAEKA